MIAFLGFELRETDPFVPEKVGICPVNIELGIT
jgi:hypothetical protein